MKLGKIIKDHCILKFPKTILSFQIGNRNICEKTIVDEYEYKILSRYVEKLLSFAVLNTLKATFALFARVFACFRFLNFVSFWPFKKRSSVIFCVLDEIWLSSLHHTTQTQNFNFDFLTSWPWMNLFWHKVISRGGRKKKFGPST